MFLDYFLPQRGGWLSANNKPWHSSELESRKNDNNKKRPKRPHSSTGEHRRRPSKGGTLRTSSSTTFSRGGDRKGDSARSARNSGPVLATSHQASYNHKTFEEDVAIGADLLQYRVVTNFEVS